MTYIDETPRVRVRGRDFTWYRIGGAVAAVIFGAAFWWQIYTIITGHNTVVPIVAWQASTRDVGTANGGAAGEPSGLLASEILSARTELQRPRAQTGPAPGQPPPPLALGQQEHLSDRPMTKGGLVLTRAWATPDDQTVAIMRQPEKVIGWTAVPYANAGVLERPDGRTFRKGLTIYETHTGAVAILGMLTLLALVLALRGRVPIVEGRDGRTVKRFGFLERANHWMTAASFVVLAGTGVLIAFGPTIVGKLWGGQALGNTNWVSAWAHMMAAAPFVLGIIVMLVVWSWRNIPDPRLDGPWIARFGGFMSDSGDNPPARKFNAGQKGTYWVAIIGGIMMIGTGIVLLFPFFWLDVGGMIWVLVAHGLIGLLLIAFFLAHAYIGTLGMQDAIHAMWSGNVDLNWAREHHELWVDEELARKGQLPPGYRPRRRGEAPAGPVVSGPRHGGV